MKFRADVTIEVQDADSIEVWDYDLGEVTGSVEEAEEAVDELNMGRIFPLDEDGVIIPQPNGLYLFILDFDTDADTVNVVSQKLIEAHDNEYD